MRYLGGKFRQAPAIAAVLRARHGTGFRYCEPFHGGMASVVRVVAELAPSVVLASDTNRPLVLLWQRLVAGTIELPNTCTDAIYDEYKRKQDHEDPLTAWYGTALSFGGFWFSSHARYYAGKREVYSEQIHVNSTMRKAAVLRSARSLSIWHADYWDSVRNLRGWVVYLDPPYAGRSKGHNFDEFDTELFWSRARALSRTNSVYVSCFECPPDFVPVHEWGDTVQRHGIVRPEVRVATNEKLVVWQPLH